MLSEVCKSPSQAAPYYLLGFWYGDWFCDPMFGWLQIRKVKFLRWLSTLLQTHPLGMFLKAKITLYWSWTSSRNNKSQGTELYPPRQRKMLMYPVETIRVFSELDTEVWWHHHTHISSAVEETQEVSRKNRIQTLLITLVRKGMAKSMISEINSGIVFPNPDPEVLYHIKSQSYVFNSGQDRPFVPFCIFSCCSCNVKILNISENISL
jgi:hypothetical protein